MTNHVSNLIGLPLAAFLPAVIGLPLMKRLATHYGIISAPYSDTLPARRVPLLGGIAIILSILLRSA